MALAIIGGMPERFKAFVDLYRQSARKAGHDPATLPVSINSHAFISDTSEQAANDFFPSYAEVMTRIGRERGWPPTTRAQFEQARSPIGALFVGSVDQVIQKILYQYELFHHDRFMAQLTVGTMPHEKVMKAIELLGTRVAPVVRKELSR